MGSTVHYFLMISDSMEKHGEHHNSLVFITSNSMEKHEKQGTAFLMISNSMGKHGEHENPFFHELKQDNKKSMRSMEIHVQLSLHDKPALDQVHGFWTLLSLIQFVTGNIFLNISLRPSPHLPKNIPV